MDDSRTSASITTELLIDGFGRIAEGVPEVVAGLSAEQLLWRPDPEANHIAWLIWHLSRQQDEQLARLGHVRSAWRSGDWAARFDLPYASDAHGYGMSSAEVGAFTVPDPAHLVGYHEAVHERTLTVLRGLGADDYGTVIDRNWNPPVTVSVRIVSVLDDAAKHLGQAQYVRGMVLRRS